jgi:hypothetical protein
MSSDNKVNAALKWILTNEEPLIPLMNTTILNLKNSKRITLNFFTLVKYQDVSEA